MASVTPFPKTEHVANRNAAITISLQKPLGAILETEGVIAIVTAGR